jgi:hypothetical protein
MAGQGKDGVMSDWKSIRSAPKTGEPILTRGDERLEGGHGVLRWGNWCPCPYSDPQMGWVNKNMQGQFFPTEWKPL